MAASAIESVDQIFSGPVDFAPHLAILSGRLQARQWPAFTAGEVGEIFSEYGLASSIGDFAYNYTGLPIDGSGAPPWPFFAQNPKYLTWASPGTGIATSILSSSWGWVSLEETGQSSVAGSVSPIGGRRSRFRVNKDVTYFYASAINTRLPGYDGVSPVTYPFSADDLTGVQILEQGTARAGQVYEIPYPAWETDFRIVKLPVRGAMTLSQGAMVFCVLGETPVQWSERTGIIIGVPP